MKKLVLALALFLSSTFGCGGAMPSAEQAAPIILATATAALGAIADMAFRYEKAIDGCERLITYRAVTIPTSNVTETNTTRSMVATCTQLVDSYEQLQVDKRELQMLGDDPTVLANANKDIRLCDVDMRATETLLKEYGYDR